MICRSGGSKVDSLKRRVVARSTFPSQNVQNTPGSDDFWKLRWWKSARRCSAKHISKSKIQNVQRFRTIFGSWDDEKVHAVVDMYKTHQLRTTFGNWDVEKVHAIVAQSTLRSQKCKKMRGMEHFWTFRCPFRVAGARDCAPCQKWAKREGFVAVYGSFKSDGSCSTRDMFIRAVRRSGRWFPDRGCILEHQIFWFSEMISRDRCSTSCDLASLFRGRRNTLDRWSGKLAKRIGTTPSALHSAFHFWRKFRRIVSFLMLSTSKIEELSQNCFVFYITLSSSKVKEVSQTCFVFGVVKFQKLRKSRRIVSFLTLSRSKNEEVSQNCFIFGIVKFQKLRKSRRIVSFLMLSTSKIEELSQNCFVFYITLSSSKVKEVSQTCFVFGVVKFQKLRKSRGIVSFLTLSRSKNWGSLAE